MAQGQLAPSSKVGHKGLLTLNSSSSRVIIRMDNKEKIHLETSTRSKKDKGKDIRRDSKGKLRSNKRGQALRATLIIEIRTGGSTMNLKGIPKIFSIRFLPNSRNSFTSSKKGNSNSMIHSREINHNQHKMNINRGRIIRRVIKSQKTHLKVGRRPLNSGKKNLTEGIAWY